MTNEQSPPYEELKRRLTNAEATLQALRTGQAGTIAGERGTLIVRLAEAQAREEHIKQVLLAIRNVNQLIVSEDDPLQLIRRACMTLTENMGYFNAWIALMDEESRAVTATACSGFDGDFAALGRRLEANLHPNCMKRALEGNGIVVVKDPKSECMDCPLSREYGGRSGLSHSLSHGGKTYGILSVSVPAACALNDEEQALFNELAGDLAFALHKIEASKHQRVNQTMLSRTERIAHIGSWEWEIAHDRVRWSEGLFRIFQRDPACGAPSFAEHSNLYVAEDMKRLRQAVERCVTDGTPYELELRAMRKDGAIRQCVARGQAETDSQGKIDRLAGSLQDITDLKLLEERIVLLGRMLDEAPASITIHDTDGNFLFANHQTSRLHGYENEEEFLALNLHDLDVPESEAMIAERIRLITETGEARFETAHYRKDGLIVPLEVTAKIITWNGRPAIFSIATDMTEHKRAEEALRKSESMFKKVFEILPIGLWIADKNGKLIQGNPAGVKIWGMEPKVGQSEYGVFKASRLPSQEEIAPEDWALAHTVNKGVTIVDELLEIDAFDGKKKIVLNYTAPLLDSNGNVEGAIVVNHDITERKHAEEALRESETFRRQIFDSSRLPVIVMDANTYIYVDCNPAAIEIYGYTSKEQVLGLTPRDFSAPIQYDETPSSEKAKFYIEKAKNEGSVVFEWKHQRPDGVVWDAEVHLLSFAFDHRGYLQFSLLDITERKKAEKALLLSEENYRFQFMNMDAYNSLYEVVTDKDGRPYDFRFIMVNHAYEAYVGKKASELIGKTLLEVYPETEQYWIDKMAEVVLTGLPIHFENFSKVMNTYAEINLYIPKKGQLAMTTANITGRKRAEEALRRSEKDLRESQRIAHVGSWRLDVATNKVVWTEELYNMYGFDPSLPPPPYTEHMKLFTPESWERLSTALARTRETGIPYTLELETVRKDGSNGWMWVQGQADVDSTGKTVGLWGAAQDITERKRAEEEKEKLQEQLNQAQKMESVGRLAGGVAHDFNNMLGVILGNLELVMEQIGPDVSLHTELKEIQKAAQRSADLTRQLLAFARKQTVDPKVLDLNETVEGMLKMLSRLIGEDIDLAWRPGDNLGRVFIDPSQIDQILANLCVNARDAIGDTGKLTIETDNVSFDEDYCARHAGTVPGEYVLLAVSDDGCGMDDETRSHLFEPFFTTKGLGKGTGLGLATVYGAVKQNKGFINVYSEPGYGTTFKIYLPRHAAKSATRSERQPAMGQIAGGETILLVEDEPAMLEMTMRMLAKMGYSVIPASRPGEAIRLARECAGQIDLVMTDVVMPEMNGRDLAANLMSIYPEIKRLFMSGYTANVIAHHGVLDKGVHFLQKPFSKKNLAAKIREALDRK